MNDKEKLEAIKQVLSDTPARSGDDKETAAWYEKALDEIDKIIDMQVCEKCKNKVPKVYNCEHTNDQDYCSDCYTELHYYLTE